MKVVILCGGKGTRMADANTDAKALVPIGGRPIIWHIMKLYAHFGHTEFVLTLGHGGEAIRRYFLEYEMMTSDIVIRLGESSHITPVDGVSLDDWTITMADTGLDTNKGARVAQVMRYLHDETFCLTYGDGLGDVDIQALIDFHTSHGKIMTITGYKPYSQYGILQLDESGGVTGFEEKPRLDSWINAGFMVCNPEIQAYLSDNSDLDLEKQILIELARDNELMMYQHHGFWRSMDTFKEVREMEEIWQTEAPWKLWT